MEEGLRLAYLAAMDIPVWLLRGSEPAPPPLPEVPEPTLMRQPVPAAREADGARLAIDLLGGAATRPGTAARPPEPRPRTAPAAPRPAPRTAPSLLLVSVGRLLFIDAANAGAGERRTVELIAAIAFALGGEKSAAHVQPFDLQALGAATGRADARDLLLGRLAKLTEAGNVEHVVLLGQQPAGVLLGWDEERFVARVARVQRVAGLEPGVLATVSCAQMLADPAQKRLAWEELSTARSRHDG